MPGTDVSEGTTGVSVGNAVGVCSISVKTDMLVGAVLVFNSDEMFPQAVNKMVKIIQKCIISINRGRLGRGAEDVSLKNQELMS